MAFGLFNNRNAPAKTVARPSPKLHSGIAAAITAATVGTKKGRGNSVESALEDMRTASTPTVLDFVNSQAPAQGLSAGRFNEIPSYAPTAAKIITSQITGSSNAGGVASGLVNFSAGNTVGAGRDLGKVAGTVAGGPLGGLAGGAIGGYLGGEGVNSITNKLIDDALSVALGASPIGIILAGAQLGSKIMGSSFSPADSILGKVEPTTDQRLGGLAGGSLNYDTQKNVLSNNSGELVALVNPITGKLTGPGLSERNPTINSNIESWTQSPAPVVDKDRYSSNFDDTAGSFGRVGGSFDDILNSIGSVDFNDYSGGRWQDSYDFSLDTGYNWNDLWTSGVTNSSWNDFNYAGGGGDGFFSSGCVSVHSILPNGITAGEVSVGDTLLLADQSTLEEGTGVVSYSKKTLQPGWRITTESGAILECSASAPIPTPDGIVNAPYLEGKRVAVLLDGKEAKWELVTKLESIGDIYVQHITVGDKCFWAGKKRGAYILHHNIKISSF